MKRKKVLSQREREREASLLESSSNPVCITQVTRSGASLDSSLNTVWTYLAHTNPR